MAAAEILGDGSPDGVTLGRATTEKVSLYGVTPVVQRGGTSSNQDALAAYGTGSTHGFDSDAHMEAFYNLVVEIRAVLVALGVMKGADA